MLIKPIAALAAATTLALTGCSQISDQLAGAQAPVAEAAAPGVAPILVTRHWAVNDGMLSVVVQNTTVQTLTYAEAVITARSADNELLALSVDEGERGCCDVVNLFPGQQYGFYVDLGDAADADRISRVEVSYRNISWDQDRSVAQTSLVRARPVTVKRGGTDSVVVADVTTDSRLPEVVAQAFLTTADGEFLAVVSGRWTCLEPGARRIRMQLFHQVPAGAQADRILIHPVTDDPTRSTPDCGDGQPL